MSFLRNCCIIQYCQLIRWNNFIHSLKTQTFCVAIVLERLLHMHFIHRTLKDKVLQRYLLVSPAFVQKKGTVSSSTIGIFLVSGSLSQLVIRPPAIFLEAGHGTQPVSPAQPKIGLLAKAVTPAKGHCYRPRPQTICVPTSSPSDTDALSSLRNTSLESLTTTWPPPGVKNLPKVTQLVSGGAKCTGSHSCR